LQIFLKSACIVIITDEILVLMPESCGSELEPTHTKLEATESPLLTDLRKLWAAHNFNVTFCRIPDDEGIILQSHPHWTAEKIISLVHSKIAAVVLVLGKEDIPKGFSLNWAMDVYESFFKQLKEHLRVPVLFPGITLVQDEECATKRDTFLNGFSLGKARKLANSTMPKSKGLVIPPVGSVHMLDLISPGRNLEKWVVQGQIVPAWQACVNLGIVFALRHLLRKENDQQHFVFPPQERDVVLGKRVF